MLWLAAFWFWIFNPAKLRFQRFFQRLLRTPRAFVGYKIHKNQRYSTTFVITDFLWSPSFSTLHSTLIIMFPHARHFENFFVKQNLLQTKSLSPACKDCVVKNVPHWNALRSAFKIRQSHFGHAITFVLAKTQWHNFYQQNLIVCQSPVKKSFESVKIGKSHSK